MMGCLRSVNFVMNQCIYHPHNDIDKSKKKCVIINLMFYLPIISRMERMLRQNRLSVKLNEIIIVKNSRRVAEPL